LTPQQQDEVTWSAGTVLMIEDSEIIRRVMALILEAEGYRVVESPTGMGAVELARSVRPNVITLDLSLPDLDGRELLHQLHAEPASRHVPVVVISAFADTLSLSERHLAEDVITKPFDLDDLIHRLDRATGRAGQSSLPRRGPRLGS
jgi:CheY-like chemotaxis protein